MNPSQTRIVDPILSKVVRGFSQEELIGNIIFPRVPVAAYGGKIIEFGKEAFRLVNSRRAPGAATKRIGFGYEGKPYVIIPSALEAIVPREMMRDASQVPGIDLASRAIQLVSNVMALNHEHECASLALNASSYGSDNKITYTASDSWYADTSNPLKDINEAKEAIRAATGRYPNLLTLSPSALSALKTHPTLLKRVQGVVIDALTIKQLEGILEIDRIVVGKGVLASDDDNFSDVWRKDAHLCFSDPSPSPNRELPSFGYTYFIEGHPMVEKPYWEENIKSWVYGVSDDNAPVIAGAGAGYLFQNAGLKA
ncbi:hypothetical protein [Oligella urethralis]|uniref:hypothetical protein n=1 Tax=Oligella urethralis TaxID=90245 RepID=UPI00288B35E0|nr:hypothetical protein [Oligella urethralis]